MMEHITRTSRIIVSNNAALRCLWRFVIKRLIFISDVSVCSAGYFRQFFIAAHIHVSLICVVFAGFVNV